VERSLFRSTWYRIY